MSKDITRLLTCYFPTTVVIVDDDKDYMKGITPKLDASQAVYRHYDSPVTALKMLKNYKANRFTDQCLPEKTSSEFDHHELDRKIRTLYHQIYNPKRFEEISVLIVDFDMPGMTGLELCDQLSDQPFKTLLLSGQANEQTVIKAFDQGRIQRYIRKGSETFYQDLNKAIRELQRSYFEQLSSVVIDSIIRDPESASTAFEDPAFIGLANEICQGQDIVEFHMTDTQGSFMLLDRDGKPSWLAVADSEQMRMYGELAEDSETPPAVREALVSKKKIPYFQSNSEPPFSEWGKYIYPAKVLKGKDTYYYAHIQDVDAYPIDESRFLSYQSYLEAL